MRSPCRITLTTLALTVLVTATAGADTVRVIADRAPVWNKPSGVSVVLTQLPRGTVVDVVGRTGDWYEIVLPVRPGAGGDRPGFIRASHVAIEASGPPTPRARRLSGGTTRRPRGRNPTIVLIDGAARKGHEELTRTSTAFAATYAEEGSIAANYGKTSGPQFSALAGQFVWGPIGVGLGIDVASRERSASLAATVPHPFFFDQDRAATFTASGLSERQTAIHIPVIWTLPSYGPTKILLFAGPTFFRVSQTLVTDLSLDDEYPHDTVAVASAVTDKRTGSVVGFHAGADASYFFTSLVGVGGGVRFSRGTLTFDNDPNAVTRAVAGSLHFAAGIRLRF